MQTAAIVVALTLLALATIPAVIWYALWLDRTVLPRLLGLPAPLARTALALCITLPSSLPSLPGAPGDERDSGRS